jgi:hypothetical protein
VESIAITCNEDPRLLPPHPSGSSARDRREKQEGAPPNMMIRRSVSSQPRSPRPNPHAAAPENIQYPAPYSQFMSISSQRNHGAEVSSLPPQHEPEHGPAISLRWRRSRRSPFPAKGGAAESMYRAASAVPRPTSTAVSVDGFVECHVEAAAWPPYRSRSRSPNVLSCASRREFSRSARSSPGTSPQPCRVLQLPMRQAA